MPQALRRRARPPPPRRASRALRRRSRSGHGSSPPRRSVTRRRRELKSRRDGSRGGGTPSRNRSVSGRRLLRVPRALSARRSVETRVGFCRYRRRKTGGRVRRETVVMGLFVIDRRVLRCYHFLCRGLLFGRFVCRGWLELGGGMGGVLQHSSPGLPRWVAVPSQRRPSRSGQVAAVGTPIGGCGGGGDLPLITSPRGGTT